MLYDLTNYANYNIKENNYHNTEGPDSPPFEKQQHKVVFMQGLRRVPNEKVIEPRYEKTNNVVSEQVRHKLG